MLQVNHQKMMVDHLCWRDQIRQHAKTIKFLIAFSFLFLSQHFATHANADVLQVLYDGVFYTASDSNSVSILMQNDEQRKATQLVVTYDPHLLVLKQVQSTGRLIPNVETIYSNTGDHRIRMIIFDRDDTGATILEGVDAIVDIQFALTLNALPEMLTTISITNAAIATNTIPAQFVENVTWNEIDVEIAVGVPDQPPTVLGRNLLFQNAPNPFNPSTIIQFEIASPGQVTIRIYDIKGRLVNKVLDDRLERGVHRISWNGLDDKGRQVASGVYLYRIETANYNAVKKMTLVR